MAKLKDSILVAAVLLKLIYALTQIENNDIALILNKLNSVRSNVNPSASNMNKLVWNEKLAAAAQLFSQTCQLNYNPDRITSFNTVGETWGAIGSPTPDYSLIIDVGWLSQRSLYSFETNTCNPDDACAFYRQLVWAGTTDVGCGSTFCPIIEEFPVPNSTTFYCYYGPAGNIPGESPYQTGTPCSECRADQMCSNNLCDSALTRLENIDIALILNKLNSERRNVNPSASNMNKLVWNEKLAAAAQLFSRTCQANSNPDRITSFNTVGETWGTIGSSTPHYSLIIDVAWLRQRSLYSFETNTCNQDAGCAFYTQLVWAESTDVGCGSTFCPLVEGFPASNPFIFFCYYGPGQIAGERPYQAGSACSQCRDDQICIDNLCGLPAGRNLTYRQNENNFIISWVASPLNFRYFCVNVTTSTAIPLVSQCGLNKPFFPYQLQFSVKCTAINVIIMEIDYTGIAQTSSMLYDPCSNETCPTPSLFARCDDPPAPVDGYLSSYNSTEENSVVTYWCDPGYYLSPPVSFSTCTKSGLWVPEPDFTRCIVVPTCSNQTMEIDQDTSNDTYIVTSEDVLVPSEAVLIAVTSFILFITGAVAVIICSLPLLRLSARRKYITETSRTSGTSRPKI